MKIERNIPKEYPNPYYNDLEYTDEFRSHKKGNPEYKPYIRVIVWLRTPTKKVISKYYATIKANLDHTKWKGLTEKQILFNLKEECIKYAKKTYKQELNEGYTLDDEVYILSANI